VARWQGWQPQDDTSARAFLAEMAHAPFWVPGQWFQLAVVQTGADTEPGQLMGDIGLCLRLEGGAHVEIGFSLARSAQGRGLGAAAVQQATQLVFAQTAAQRVVAITDTRNTPAARLLQRLGFAPTNTLDAVFNGLPCQEHHFVLHRPGHSRALLRQANASDAADVAAVLFESRQVLMPYLPQVHSQAEMQHWVATQLIPGGGVTLACIDAAVVAVLATSDSDGVRWIEQLYVAPAHVGAGIGSQLLNHALAAWVGPVRLYTFQANLAARRFYEHRGFVAIAFGDGLNTEERCADVLYERAPT
jgi:RimJ/RimL family protein N-acetyltransferase